MNKAILSFIAVACVAAISASPADASPGLVSVLSGKMPAFQFGDEYGYGSGGGRGAGPVATAKNIRISAFFTAVPIEGSDMTDDSNTEPWTNYFDSGLGGGLNFQYLVMPAVRVGLGSGYVQFTGKTRETILGDIEFDPIVMIPVRLEAVLVLPIDLPTGDWFKSGKGFVPGLAPYFGIELAGIYRQAVGAEWGTWDIDFFEGGFTFGFAARIGVEYRLPGFAVFADFGYNYFSPPKEDDDLNDAPQVMTGWPVRFGIAFYFGGGGGGGSNPY